MNIEIIKENLKKVIEIVERNNAEMDETASRFNIFYTLSWALYEVNHSKFIAMLLDKKGTHSFGNEFCKYFFELLPFDKNNIVSGFNFDDYVVEVEKLAGEINQDYTSGGRIDITDKSNKRIIIENKIYASDQQNQLLRYYNFDPNALLLYLTLDGKTPTEWSTNNEIQNNTHFHCISYKDFILKWLEKCVEKSKHKPKPRVSETISQYLSVIEDYTHQNHNDKMTEEIVKLLAENKDFYNAIDDINQAYYIFRNKVQEKFWEQIEDKSQNRLIYETKNGLKIKFNIDEDANEFFFGFFVENSNGQIEIVSELKSIFNTFYSNHYYIGWTHSRFFRKFYL